MVAERQRPRVRAPREQHREPDRVGHPTAHDQRQLHAGQVIDERRCSDDRRPAHHEVERVGDLPAPTGIECRELEHDAEHRHRTHDHEERDAPRPRQRHETQRHVRPGDQQVDHGVIEPLHDLLGAQTLGEAVVGRRGTEEAEQRGTVDRRADRCRRAVGEHDQRDRSRDRREEGPRMHPTAPHRTRHGEIRHGRFGHQGVTVSEPDVPRQAANRASHDVHTVAP